MDGLMVVSTIPDLESMFNHNLRDNSTFAADFPTLNQSVADLGYFDFTAFNDYVTMSMKDTAAPEETVTAYTNFMSPFKDISWTSWADSDTVWSTMQVNVDVAGLEKTFQLAQEWITMAQESYDYYDIPASPFSPTPKYCDVHDTDWFFSYVVDLSQLEIVEGYEDGCFHPERNVTRAEFTKMALHASEKAGNYYDYDSQEFADRFIDVDYSSDWFAPVVDKAAANGLVGGYGGKTFHPNDPIARSEAVQILFNMSAQMKSVGSPTVTTFSDVQPSDWFYGAVRGAQYYNIVSGVTPITFEPTRFLTRAEAAKIISGFYHLETPIE